MKRSHFLQVSGLVTGGIMTGIIQPGTLIAGRPRVGKLILPRPSESRRRIVIDKTDEAAWVGWLGRLVVGSLVTALSAKIVERWSGGCYCENGACSANSPDAADYTNPEGIYGYNATNKRFITQQISDPNVGFTNYSVPFLTGGNSTISHVEGPFLAGLCWAVEDLSANYSTPTVCSVVVPVKRYTSGGYRFDMDPCGEAKTKFKTAYGNTELAFTNTGGDSGSVKVTARDEYDNIDWQKTYDFEY